jgi:hypothetical protein
MSKRVALSLLNNYADNETAILDKLNHAHFADYMRLLGRLLPRAPENDALDLETAPAWETQLVLDAVRAAVGRVEAGDGTLADIEAALLGQPAPFLDPGERRPVFPSGALPPDPFVGFAPEPRRAVAGPGAIKIMEDNGDGLRGADPRFTAAAA